MYHSYWSIATPCFFPPSPLYLLPKRLHGSSSCWIWSYATHIPIVAFNFLWYAWWWSILKTLETSISYRYSGTWCGTTNYCSSGKSSLSLWWQNASKTSPSTPSNTLPLLILDKLIHYCRWLMKLLEKREDDVPSQTLRSQRIFIEQKNIIKNTKKKPWPKEKSATNR